MDGSLYVFCGMGGRRLKILYRDRYGFCLWMKRLEQDSFRSREAPEAVRTISSDQLAMLSGVIMKRHQGH